MSMTLKEWLDANAKRQTDVAAELGCAQSQISRLARSKGRASPELAFAIEEMTKGAVTAKSLLLMETAA